LLATLSVTVKLVAARAPKVVPLEVVTVTAASGPLRLPKLAVLPVLMVRLPVPTPPVTLDPLMVVLYALP
jgi:hypothetical protein